MTRVAATLRGYATVAQAAEVLHLAPRSVRDLIYSGRLPSLRAGRLHYVKASDLELERRRRLHLPLPQPSSARRRSLSRLPRSRHAELGPGFEGPGVEVRQHTADLRRERAAGRNADRLLQVRRWSQRHRVSAAEASLPFRVRNLGASTSCTVCHRELPGGRIVEYLHDNAAEPEYLCLACGRRALLDFADVRRAEAISARQLARNFGQALPEPSDHPRLLVA